jgi:hypothetical protein
MSLLAYALSRSRFKYRKQLSFYVFFTMLFNGGLVPWYIWLTQGLHLKDKVEALILPYLIVPWFVLLLRTYFAQLPEELLDSARVDGAGEWRIFFQFVVPLSTPSLATIGLFCILMYWNDWWLALLFINEPKLHPLQYMLYTIFDQRPGHGCQSHDHRHEYTDRDSTHGDGRAGHRPGGAGISAGAALLYQGYHRWRAQVVREGGQDTAQTGKLDSQAGRTIIYLNGQIYSIWEE